MDFANGNQSGTIAMPSIAKRSLRHLPLKRAFDIFFSLFAMMIGFPLYALIALLVKVTSKGSVIYGHERVGRGGRLFKCYKFRTMRVDADEMLREVLATDPAARKEWEEKRKLMNDPRVTLVGRILRKSCLDEIPQFWNVLRGDLSVVGPRPVCVDEITQYYGPKAYKILAVRPGLTGIWQTSDRRVLTYSERIEMDEMYVDRQSFLLDLLLVLKTIPAILRPRGAC